MSTPQLEVDDHADDGVVVASLTPSGAWIDLTNSSLSAPEARVAAALLRCVARWGLSKTTIEDIARESGVSRATVYRLFPGGRQAIMDAALRAEVQRLLGEVTAAVEQANDIEQCLVLGLHCSACFIEENPALSFMQDHERPALEQLLSFERLDVLFLTAGTVMQPVLSRFLEPSTALETGIWAARLVLSYLSEPADDLDLCDVEHVRRLVRTFMLPGLTPSAVVDIDVTTSPN
ncbi:hypothetical protein BH10ACT3_BH10ACT3_03610 [soil metagenome]